MRTPFKVLWVFIIALAGLVAYSSFNQPNGNASASSTTASTSTPSAGDWNGYAIDGVVPDACKGKAFPSNRDLAEAAESVDARYGNPKGNVESELILSGNYSFAGLGVDQEGKCTVYVSVRGVYDGTSFSDNIPATLR